MSKITKITMDGFKSFQRKTAVPFYEGMTAIVGSNGSGKSNIQEAIQFVLGQRSSELRAEKLEQLIFNGGDNRKPAEKAEVTLYLDNSDGRYDDVLDEEEKGTKEVTIGRKIKRNGYSTYRFMGSNCKRSKIDDVMAAGDIDMDGYNIVRQGRITAIVKETPVQRRKAIDRISGIASYEDKKQRALEELEQVEEELAGLQIKLDMKRERLEQLRREKEDAEEYRELEQRKQRLELSILHVRKNELEHQLGRLDDKGEERIDELEEAVEEADARIEELEDELDQIEEEIEKGRDHEIMRDIQNIKSKIDTKEGKIENKKSKISDIEELLKDYKNVQRSTTGGSRAVNAVLDLGLPGVYGTVESLIHYNDRFAVAIETAAGARLQNVVVDSRETAIQCVNHLKENSIGRATFLPLDKISAPHGSQDAEKAVRMSGVIDYAINLVDYDDQYEKAMKSVFGDTLVAEGLSSVKKAGRVRAVTLDGDILRKGGAITGGAKKRRKKSRKSAPSFNPEEKKAERDKLQREIEELKDELKDLQLLLNEKEEAEEEASDISEELKAERKRIREDLKELREQRKENAEELNTLQHKLGREQKKKAQYKAELKNVEQDLSEHTDMDVDEDELEDGSLKGLRTKKTNTITKMNELGNVNLRAIEEFDEFKEEYDEFKERVDQIKQEKREIDQIIEDIEEQKRERFMAALNEVNDHFDRIFQKLFDGGSASLELEEAENIDSGLVIRAQPPNKDPHMIDALSGGEKTLTAIAFMFALQEYNASPFYVMDEIDAALDDTNAKRLSELFKEYAEDYQFIVISHNNETVRHADRAYGISMTEGVSKVRSVELENN